MYSNTPVLKSQKEKNGPSPDIPSDFNKKKRKEIKEGIPARHAHVHVPRCCIPYHKPFQH